MLNFVFLLFYCYLREKVVVTSNTVKIVHALKRKPGLADKNLAPTILWAYSHKVTPIKQTFQSANLCNADRKFCLKVKFDL